MARINAVSHGVADRMQFLAADLLPGHLDQPYTVVARTCRTSRPTTWLPSTGSCGSSRRSRSMAGPTGWTSSGASSPCCRPRCAPDGVALLEIGADQADLTLDAVASILPGWRCEILPDLAGRARVARIARIAPVGRA